MQQAQALGALQTVVFAKIVQPLVVLLFFVATMYFLYGLAVTIWRGSSDEARSKGRRHMMYGVVGMAIMFSAFAIVRFVFNTVVTDAGGGTGIYGDTIPKPSVIDNGFQ